MSSEMLEMLKVLRKPLGLVQIMEHPSHRT
jgi:hypothetical protein